MIAVGSPALRYSELDNQTVLADTDRVPAGQRQGSAADADGRAISDAASLPDEKGESDLTFSILSPASILPGSSL